MRETQTIHARLSTGQSGLLILTETGPDTGVFAGAFSTISPTSHAQACLPPLPAGATVYIDFPAGPDWTGSQDQILIDPFGHVFDSSSGAPVDGVSVTIVDDATGQPAQVYNDDGVTPYPSTVISGNNVTDSGGEVHVFSAGDYRFPLVKAGSYHLQMRAPPGYVAPSRSSPPTCPPGRTVRSIRRTPPTARASA
ncbi:MAG: carboxypeptidase-like regulatory domain-containing protein [Asticcacaulis sp.]